MGKRTLVATLRARVQSQNQGGGRRGWLEAVALGLCRSSPSTKGRERKEVLQAEETT